MKLLSSAISEIIIEEYSVNEFLRRIANPFFFQALGCVVGFDWHSSGLTTTLCAALKEALNKKEIGVYIAGGKGATSKQAPNEIQNFSEKLNLSYSKSQELVKASRLSAKIDNSLIQDGYQLYHHIFILTEKGKWAVIQQGMNTWNRLARRYHWLSDNVVQFVEEPHIAICTQKKEPLVLDMTAKKSKEARAVSLDLVKDGWLLRESSQRTLFNFKILNMPTCHSIKDELKLNCETLRKAAEIQPKSYEELIMVPGFGPKHVRALALISELIYNAEPSWEDPARFSFAHGGKDGYPYPVDKEVYDSSITILKNALEKAKIGRKEKMRALARLAESWNGLQSSYE
jgi:hypothetical protein